MVSQQRGWNVFLKVSDFALYNFNNNIIYKYNIYLIINIQKYLYLAENQTFKG